LAAGRQVERRRLDRAPGRAAGRPSVQPPPHVRPGLERRDARDVGLRRAVLQVPRKKWREDLAAKGLRGVAVEPDRAERAAVVDLLAMEPRTQDEENLVLPGVLGLDRLVDRRRA